MKASPYEAKLGSRPWPASTGCKTPASPARWPCTNLMQQGTAVQVQVQTQFRTSQSFTRA